MPLREHEFVLGPPARPPRRAPSPRRASRRAPTPPPGSRLTCALARGSALSPRRSFAFSRFSSAPPASRLSCALVRDSTALSPRRSFAFSGFHLSRCGRLCCCCSLRGSTASVGVLSAGNTPPPRNHRVPLSDFAFPPIHCSTDAEPWSLLLSRPRAWKQARGERVENAATRRPRA
jgi:hypothetical protein